MCLQNPVPAAGTVIEGQNRLGAGGNPAQGHGDHQHEALGNGGAGHHLISQLRPAVTLQNRVHGDDHDIVHRHNQKGRQTGEQNPPHPPKLVAAEGNGDRHLLAEQKPQHVGTAGHLREHGGHRCSHHAQIQGEDKHRVQHDIQHRSQHHGDHAALGIALANDELIQAQRQQVEYRSAQIGREVGLGVRIRHLAGTEGPQHGLPQREHCRCQHHTAHAQHQKAVRQDVPGFFPLSRAQADAHQRRTAHADPGGKGADHGHHRTAHAHTCQGRIADQGNIADINPVHNAVEHADKLGQHAGNGNPPHQGPDGIRSQVVLQFHNMSLRFHTQKWDCRTTGSPIIIIHRFQFASPVFPQYLHSVQTGHSAHTPRPSKSGVYSSLAEVRSWV